jgi:short-subunit dehydrogenase involved in D-alanine esterification of teichoic acids
MSLPSYKYIKKLNGKRVLILSGTSSIGFAVAEACFEHDANIIISGSNPERLEKNHTETPR